MLEVRDEALVAFVHRTRQILGYKEFQAPIHITVQGPFPEPVSGSKLLEYESLFSDDPLVVTGVGSFKSPSAVVFLRVHHPKFKSIWNKPDFPVDKYGINPHITLWEGGDNALRAELEAFLRGEVLAFYCEDFRFIQYTSRQLGLFDDRVPYRAERRFALSEKGRVNRSFYVRLSELVGRHGLPKDIGR